MRPEQVALEMQKSGEFFDVKKLAEFLKISPVIANRCLYSIAKSARYKKERLTSHKSLCLKIHEVKDIVYVRKNKKIGGAA